MEKFVFERGTKNTSADDREIKLWQRSLLFEGNPPSNFRRLVLPYKEKRD